MTDAARLHPDDIRAIAAEVARELGHRSKPANGEPSSDWMTQEQACAFLGYTPQHVRRLKVPHHKRGRRVRYKRSELEAWVSSAGEGKSA